MKTVVDVGPSLMSAFRIPLSIGNLGNGSELTNYTMEIVQEDINLQIL